MGSMRGKPGWQNMDEFRGQEGVKTLDPEDAEMMSVSSSRSAPMAEAMTRLERSFAHHEAQLRQLFDKLDPIQTPENPNVSGVSGPDEDSPEAGEIVRLVWDFCDRLDMMTRRVARNIDRLEI